jgi:hypothetical protein
MNSRIHRRHPKLIPNRVVSLATDMETHTIYLLVFIFLVLDGSQVQCCVVREYETAWLEVLVPSKEDCVEHRFVQQEVTHPLRDDDVILFDRKLSFFEFTFNKGDNWSILLSDRIQEVTMG